MKKIIKAPGKINLFLSVNGIRPDKYHDLFMIMQCVSIFDTIEIEIFKDKKKEIMLITDKPYLPNDNRNLIYQVIEYMQNKYNISDTFKVKVKKLIPTSAGLGGGSSDAASVLHFINNTYKLKMPISDLSNVSSLFGSDIPFFIYKHESICKGRGEIVIPIKNYNNYFILLVTPNIRVSTKEIFSKYEMISSDNISNEVKEKNLNELVLAIEKKKIKDIARLLYNDLEKVTESMFPEVTYFKKRMIELGAVNSLMSGSGPTVFGIFTSFFKAINCKNILKKEYKDAFVFVARPV